MTGSTSLAYLIFQSILYENLLTSLPIINPANRAISNQLKAHNFNQNDTTPQFSDMEVSLRFFNADIPFNLSVMHRPSELNVSDWTSL